MITNNVPMHLEQANRSDLGFHIKLFALNLVTLSLLAADL